MWGQNMLAVGVCVSLFNELLFCSSVKLYLVLGSQSRPCGPFMRSIARSPKYRYPACHGRRSAGRHHAGLIRSIKFGLHYLAM